MASIGMRENIGSLSTKAYNLGDVIAYDSKPFVYALMAECKSKYCDYCVKENSGLKKCSACKCMYYCNRNCQKSDRSIHQFECNLLKNYREKCVKNENDWEEEKTNVFNSMIYLRLTLITREIKGLRNENRDLHNGQQRNFNDLISHENMIKTDVNRNIKFTLLAALFIKLGVIDNSDVEIENLLGLVGRYDINSLALIDSQNYYMNSLCGALSIPLSVFNHSCAPNAIFVNIGTRMEIRAVQQITPNDEITISYINFENNKIDRQLKLENYNFKCECIKCIDDSVQDFEYKQCNELLAEYRKYYLIPLNGEICDNTSLIINDESIKYSIGLGEKILNLKEKMFKYDYFYSHIRVVHSMWLIASIHHECDVISRQHIEHFIELTKHHLIITHGINHENYKQFDNVLQLWLAKNN